MPVDKAGILGIMHLFIYLVTWGSVVQLLGCLQVRDCPSNRLRVELPVQVEVFQVEFHWERYE